MEPVILADIEKTYGNTTACSAINLHIEIGELFTLLGPSGCGKTTILRLIAGFIHPDRGTIHIGGKDITRIAPEKRQIGMVFQNYALFPFMTVAENIAYGLTVQKRAPLERSATVARYIEMVGLKGFEERSIAELSGGEQQRVALARSLAVEPKVLLLDEPLSNLDARLRDKMRAEIQALRQQLGITTIFVTHDQSEAMTISNRIAVFDRGRCVQAGTPEDIYNRPANSFVAGFIGETNLFPATVSNDMARLSERVALRLSKADSGNFVSIRPQDIVVVKDSSCDIANIFTARVDNIHFAGSTIDYLFGVEDLHFRATALNTSSTLPTVRIGSEVRIGIAAESVAVLPD